MSGTLTALGPGFLAERVWLGGNQKTPRLRSLAELIVLAGSRQINFPTGGRTLGCCQPSSCSGWVGTSQVPRIVHKLPHTSWRIEGPQTARVFKGSLGVGGA